MVKKEDHVDEYAEMRRGLNAAAREAGARLVLAMPREDAIAAVMRDIDREHARIGGT